MGDKVGWGVVGSCGIARRRTIPEGLYPTNPKDLGKEVPIGQGKVGFPRLIQRLKELGYRGPLNIEREISGPEQIADIKKAKIFLEQLIG